LRDLNRIDIQRNFERHGLEILELTLDPKKTTDPMSVVVSHTSYPNIEAHLFTVADAAGLIPRLTSAGDVEIMLSSDGIHDENSIQWTDLFKSLNQIMEWLQPYRKRLVQGDIPAFIWAHHEFRWHRRLWDSHYYTPRLVEEFIDYVDESIRPHISELNQLSFATVESCSGRKCEHPDREPYWPYVMFDERGYPGVAPHLFTLADVSGWDANYAPHYFDIYLRAPGKRNILQSFDRLVSNGRKLSSLLKENRLVSCSSGKSFEAWRQAGCPTEGVL
jgi:hypothetical protein